MNNIFSKKILTVLFVIIAFTLSSCREDNSELLEHQIDSLNSTISALEATIEHRDELLADFDSQLDKYGNLNDSMKVREAEINRLQSVISRRGYATGAESKRLNRLLVEMDTLISRNKDLVRQLDSIDYQNASQEQIVALMLNNIDDKQKQINMLKHNISTLKKRVRGLEIDNTNLQRQTDSLENYTEEIKQQANVITLYNLNVDLPVNSITKKVKKAKKIDQMNLCFTLNKNKFVPAGTKTVFIRILRPDGFLLDPSSETFLYEDKQINYTLKTQIEYNPDGSNHFCKNWRRTNTILEKGKYLVFIYIDGKEVGEKSFYLR